MLKRDLYFELWDLASDGIYFFENEGDQKDVIHFLDFKNGEIQTVSDPKAGPRRVGLELTPDERWFLFSTFEIPRTDLMLVENFQ